VSCVNRLGELFPKTPQKCKVSLTPQEEEEEEEEDGVPKISVPLGLTSGRCLFWAGAYFGPVLILGHVALRLLPGTKTC